MNANGKIPCSVEILTRNSQATLERCLESVKDFGEIIILDGNSTDRTREIGARYGARILKQYDTDEPEIAIRDFSEVRNKGLQASFYKWFMFIDADEYLSPIAAKEIRSIVLSQNPAAHVWWQPRKYVWEGTVIDCASTYPNKQMRFFHTDWVKGFAKPIHEKILLKEGARVGTLAGFEYVPLDTLHILEKKWRNQMRAELRLCADASRYRIAKAILRNKMLLILYIVRYIRGGLFCSGERLPFSVEYARHAQTAWGIWRLFLQFFVPSVNAGV